jgi:hypothetical protein
MEKVYPKRHKLQLIMFKMGLHDKMSDPIALFKWETIGLKRSNDILGKKVSKGWCFLVINEHKLVHTMMKHEFTLET